MLSKNPFDYTYQGMAENEMADRAWDEKDRVIGLRIQQMLIKLHGRHKPHKKKAE